MTTTTQRYGSMSVNDFKETLRFQGTDTAMLEQTLKELDVELADTANTPGTEALASKLRHMRDIVNERLHPPKRISMGFGAAEERLFALTQNDPRAQSIQARHGH